jgi:hypothetical protein
MKAIITTVDDVPNVNNESTNPVFEDNSVVKKFLTDTQKLLTMTSKNAAKKTPATKIPKRDNSIEKKSSTSSSSDDSKPSSGKVK